MVERAAAAVARSRAVAVGTAIPKAAARGRSGRPRRAAVEIQVEEVRDRRGVLLWLLLRTARGSGMAEGGRQTKLPSIVAGPPSVL